MVGRSHTNVFDQLQTVYSKCFGDDNYHKTINHKHKKKKQLHNFHTPKLYIVYLSRLYL